MHWWRSAALTLLACVALALPAVAQPAPYVYPARGQSPDKQGQDEYACYGWAKQQTGFDALRPQAAPAKSSKQPNTVSNVAGGAAIGAVGGAVVGKLLGKRASTGALLGGGTGALLGAGKTHQESEAAKRSQQQAQAGQQARVNE